MRRLGASEEDLEAIEEELGEARQPFHHVADVRRAKEDDEAQEISSHKKRKSAKKVKVKAKDRSESRLERRREDAYDDADSEEGADDRDPRAKDVISGEQIIEASNKKQGKVKNIEVLDEDNFISQEEEEEEGEAPESESGDLLKKLIENLSMNPALKNESIREQFKLDQIGCEEDLHEYKNLLNAMAALFYTNHRMQDVTILFYLWKEAALALQG